MLRALVPYPRRPSSKPTLGLLVLLGAALLAVEGLPAPATADELPTASAAPAGRLKQLAGRRGCIHKTGVNRCARGRAITSPEDVVISPDGRHAYVAAFGSNAVAAFSRSRRTGALRQLPGRRGCIRHRFRGSCAVGRALAKPASIAVSPDGRNVYVAATGSSAVSVFARNRRSGALRQLPASKGCISQRPGGDCAVGRALNEPVAVAVAPDGRRVYVAARRFPSAIAVLARGPDGALTQAAGEAGCLSQAGRDGCAVGRGMRSPEDVDVSPDGRSVFVASMGSNAVAVLRRTPEGLSQPPGTGGCIAKTAAAGCAVGRALTGAVDLSVTPDGSGVYVASSLSDAVAILRHDEDTGALSQAPGRAGCLGQAGSARCARGRALDEVWGVAISPDARNVYAVSAKTNALGLTARNRATGRLTQLPGRFGCLIRGGVVGCPEGRGLTVAVAVTVSPDGRNVYVASEDTHLGAVGVFRRLR